MPDLYTASRRQEANRSEVLRHGPGVVRAQEAKATKISRGSKLIHRYHRLVKNLSTKMGLIVAPRNMKFAYQEKDETILLLLRRHLVTNAPWVIVFIFMIGVIFPVLHFHYLSRFPSTLQVMIVYGWVLLALMVFWAGFLSWYFNIDVISNKRVVDIDFCNLIYREVSDAEIEKIQDVTYKMGGLLSIIFNYGDVYIQTAGTKPEIEFLKIPRPAAVADALQRIREEVDHGL